MSEFDSSKDYDEGTDRKNPEAGQITTALPGATANAETRASRECKNSSTEVEHTFEESQPHVAQFYIDSSIESSISQSRQEPLVDAINEANTELNEKEQDSGVSNDQHELVVEDTNITRESVVGNAGEANTLNPTSNRTETSECVPNDVIVTDISTSKESGGNTDTEIKQNQQKPLKDVPDESNNVHSGSVVIKAELPGGVQQIHGRNGILNGSRDNVRQFDADADSGRCSPNDFEGSRPARDDKLCCDGIIQRISDVQTTLLEHADEDKIRTGLLDLLLYCQPSTVKLMTHLEETQVDLHIMSAMMHVPTSQPIQQTAIHLLSLLADLSDKIAHSMVQHNIHSYIVRLLTSFPADPSIQEHVLQLTGCLLYSDEFYNRLVVEGCICDVMKAVCAAIANFPESVSIQMAASQAILKLVEDDASLQDQWLTSVGFRLLDSLRTLTDQSLILGILRILRRVAKHKKHTDTLISRDLHVTLMELCCKSSTCEDVLCEAFEALCHMISYECVQNSFLHTNFVPKGLRGVLEGHPRSYRIQMAGLCLIRPLVSELLRDQKRVKDISAMLTRQVYIVMFSYMDYPDLQEEGCCIISLVLEHYPEAHCWIGDSLDKHQYPVHSMCLCALLMYGRRETVYTCVCDTIYWLAADNERLCKALEGKNAHLAILEGLRRHGECPRAVAAGCRALRGLCIFLYDHKDVIFRDGAFARLTKLQMRYEKDVNVQIEVLSLIICLTDIDIVRYQCFVDKVPDNIIATMNQFPDSALMQETGLEAFAALSVADGGQEMLVIAGALRSTLSTLLQYPNRELIQKKGMIVLQLFAAQAVQQAPAVRKQVAVIIHSALATFPTSKGVLTETCVALQLLAECDQEMSNLFVHNGCHEFLFSFLEHAELGPGLESLAGECLYVLSQEQNLKSSMLLSACQSGMLPATECLVELGADVNTGRHNRTPLVVAVQHQQQDVVKLLLRYNVQDLLSPLSESLELDSLVITGLLLQKLGYNKHDGVISWAGLDLKRLDASWIVTTLTETLTKDTDQFASQVYLEKIKHGETRRKSRKKKLAHSRSDSSVRPPRVRIRHQSQDTSYVEFSFAQDEVPPMVVQSPSRQLLSRSQSVEESLGSQPSTPTAFPPFMASTSQIGDVFGSTDDPVFELSPTEEQDWRQNTITGAPVSYSSQDPRQSPRQERKASYDVSSPWIRKREKPSRNYSSSSDEGAKMTLPRKLSVPVISHVNHQQLDRKMSLGSKITEVEHHGQPRLSTANLVVIDISETQLSDLNCLCDPQLKGHLLHLEKLDVNGNRLTYLPENLYQNLPSLQNLDATYNSIDEFPKGLLHCRRLQELNLSHNIIETIELTGNSSLKRLYLSHNEVKALPEDLGNSLQNLKELLLDNNDIFKLPGSPLGLKLLKKLDISHNCLDELPCKFLQVCEKLETLDLSFNQLSQLPHENLATRLPNLSKVKLKNNLLTEKPPFWVPKLLLALPELKSLDLSENQLTGLPHLSMWTSTNMRSFFANRNRITQLPLQPVQLWINLEKLHIAHNNLKELPREIGQLTSLRSLDFSYNPGITSLPDELGRCNNLYEMPVDGLELDLNRALLNRRVKDIISYLHNRLKQAQRYYRMKLMVVGFGDRGKTTLLNTLMKRSNNKRENRPTVGVLVRDWKYTRFERKLSEDMSGPRLFTPGRKVECTLNTWDFAGQEEFYSTHNCYLSKRAVYLVVFDLHRKVADVEKLKVWLTSIRSRAPGCPVIVVGTHLDKLPKDLERLREETSKVGEKLREFNIKPGFPNITAVHLVDASCENDSIVQLRNTIMTVVHKFEIGKKRVMGEKIPASYVKLSELLTEMARQGCVRYPVITHQELMKVVADEQLDLDEEELQQAMTFLHESGVILHYDDTSLHLKDLYFIDPSWLCRMMAQVITVRQIIPFVMNGILRKKDIQLLFNSEDSKFPNHLIPQYIKLLEKFEIALPHSNTELLIPSKLPTQRPEIHLPTQDKILRIYRMPHVPIGLMYRLISRLLSLTSQKGFQLMLKLPKCPRKVFWRQGVYIFWSHEAYFMVEYIDEDKSQSETIKITVPASCQGSMLLGQIVDNLDNLIDEWYPGLTCIYPMMGQEIREILVPCSYCSADAGSKGNMFTIRELQTRATTEDSVHCPCHDGDMLISELAPDLVLGDIEEEFKLDRNIFQFKESPENRLGDGGFGDVHRGYYGDKEVAVKSFKEIGDIHPLTMLRQEATILRCLKHPSVVSLVAVGIQPCVILLELASNGTLASLIKPDRSLTKPLLQRIAMQVADGLDYLHGLMIVFRDMKPDNVLIFSTSLDTEINAKISDSGISRFTSLQGLKAPEGTLGYRAPEVIRKENYFFSADIFSYGLTMYVMLARKHPFYKKESKGEMDRAIAEGEQIPEIVVTSGSTSSLPDMQHLVMRCISYLPSERPSAKTIVQLLQRPEVLVLQKIIPVSKSTTVECFAIEEFCVSDTKRLQQRLWIASGDSRSFQLSFINFSDPTASVKGHQFYYGRIMCMQYLTEGHLALGTQRGLVWLYNTHTNNLVHASAQLKDSVLCMRRMPMEKEDGLLFAGLANGRVALFPVRDFIIESNLDPICLYPGEESDPVRCMVRMGQRIFVSCGSKIVILNMNTGISVAVEKIVETDPSKSSSNTPICTMCVQKGYIVFTKMNSLIVYVWDATKDKIPNTFNAGNVLGLTPVEARITTVLSDNQYIWIGTHSGHIGIIDIHNQRLLAITQRYTNTVRCLLKVKVPRGLSSTIVFSGGLGYKSLDGTNSSSNCGSVLMWDANFPDLAKAASDYDSKRVAYKKHLDRQYDTEEEEAQYDYQR